MAPYTPAFLPQEISAKVLETADGKRNKTMPKDFDLQRDCKLQELWQYECLEDVDGNTGRTRIKCHPIQRLFRRCENGTLIETTRWEGERKDIKFDWRNQKP